MEQNSPVFNLDDSAMADTRRNDDASGDEEEKEESVECVEVIRDPCYPPDGFVPPSQRSPVPPLAGILDRKLEEIDPRLVFRRERFAAAVNSVQATRETI
jgi:hypothetical protein